MNVPSETDHALEGIRRAYEEPKRFAEAITLGLAASKLTELQFASAVRVHRASIRRWRLRQTKPDDATRILVLATLEAFLDPTRLERARTEQLERELGEAKDPSFRAGFEAGVRRAFLYAQSSHGIEYDRALQIARTLRGEK